MYTPLVYRALIVVVRVRVFLGGLENYVHVTHGCILGVMLALCIPAAALAPSGEEANAGRYAYDKGQEDAEGEK